MSNFLGNISVPTHDIYHVTVTLTPPEVLVSDEALRIFQWICCAVICQLVDIFGTVTNIINIICFVKQGFKDPVNVSFLGLAISDLGCLVTLIWSNICFNPLFYAAVDTFDTRDIQYLTAGWPHVMFTRITSWITALITLERCLCITMPLKVKTIFTSKRVTVTLLIMCIVLICSVAPVYYANRIGGKFFPKRNKTMLGLVYTDDRAVVEEVTFATNLLFPFAAFMIVIVCTVILVIELRRKAEWRMKCTRSSQKVETTSERDQRMARMVVMISTLFIACFIPLCFTFIVALVEPEVAMGGRYENTLLVLGGVNFLLESMNSSMNIFIYYHMSSRYRVVFRQLFSWKKK